MDGFIFDEDDAEVRRLNTVPRGDAMDCGGYYPEVVPLTTSRQPSTAGALPKGLGGSSPYEWDVFDPWALESGRLVVRAGRIRPTAPVTHLGRLLAPRTGF